MVETAPRKQTKRVKTPTILQMEILECGAACLGMVAGYYGRHLPLAVLREECGVSRDGSKAAAIVRAAMRMGFNAEGFRNEVDDLRTTQLPAIIHWNFNHFVVLEGFGSNDWVYLNDPALGRRRVKLDEFKRSFTGVTLTFEPTAEFAKGGSRDSPLRAIRERTKGIREVLVFLLLTSLALILPGLVLPTLSRVFVDDYLIQGKEEWLRPLLLGIALTALMRAFLTFLKQRYLLAAYAKVSAQSSASFVWKLFELPITFFLSRSNGEIGDRIRLNDKVAELLSGKLAMSALDLIMIVFYAFLLALYDVRLTLVGIAIAALNLIVLYKVGSVRKEQTYRLQIEGGKLMGVSMGALQLIETLKAGGNESDSFSKWSGHWAKVQNALQEMEVSTLYLSIVPTLLSALNAAVVLTLGGFAVVEGTMTVGMLVAYQSLMASFMAPVESLMRFSSTLQEAGADLMRLEDVTHYVAPKKERAPHDWTDHETVGPKTVTSKLAGKVTISDLTFGYIKQGPPLIKGFSLDLLPGSRVALVGGSGSGKSTVARVVAGLYAPWEGTVSFDGIVRSQFSAPFLAHSLATVDQEISLFEGTIRENLTLWDSSISDERVTQAARDALIHDDIMERDGGYDSKVEEGGRNFSGGQRQRLEIARALVRDPTILVLDEATSALDPKTEQLIDGNLRRRGCTCLIVAHRLSTIRDCDEILVLEQGVVVERGPHEELMEAGSHYARLMGTT